MYLDEFGNKSQQVTSVARIVAGVIAASDAVAPCIVHRRRDAVWPVLLGLTAGLAGTYCASRLVAGFLFETTPYDPVTLAAAVVLLGAAAGCAAWLPARRAATIDPISALRAE